MDTYFRVSGIIFNAIILLLLIGTQVKSSSRTYILNETETDDEWVKGIERLYVNIYDLFTFGLEVATTDSEKGIKEVGKIGLFINTEDQSAVRVLLTNKTVVYLKFYKFWKS